MKTVICFMFLKRRNREYQKEKHEKQTKNCFWDFYESKIFAIRIDWDENNDITK